MIRRTIPILAVVLLAGCGFLSRKENHFYSLDTIPRAADARALSGAPIAIDAIELPPGIDRREIVIRGADLKLEMRGTHQWASPIEDMVMHTLAFDLANRLPEGMIILPGQTRSAATTRSISVVFEDLAAGADRVFVLDARWTVTDPGVVPVTHHERITIDMASLDSAVIAAAMSQALGTLAERMTAAL
jgi:uncharacterized protein